MASPAKQRGTKTPLAKNDVDELPVSKDLRVKGSEARIYLLCKKAMSSKPTPWDKVCINLAQLEFHLPLSQNPPDRTDQRLRSASQEDLLDFLYWMRQFIAIVAGVAWGLVPLTGLYAFLG